MAVVETAMLSYKWIYWGPVEIHFIVLYLQMVQFLVLCLFYSKLVFKVYKMTHLIKRVTWPTTSVILFYFTVVLGVAIFQKKDNAHECKGEGMSAQHGRERHGLAAALCVCRGGGRQSERREPRGVPRRADCCSSLRFAHGCARLPSPN